MSREKMIHENTRNNTKKGRNLRVVLCVFVDLFFHAKNE